MKVTMTKYTATTVVRKAKGWLSDQFVTEINKLRQEMMMTIAMRIVQSIRR